MSDPSDKPSSDPFKFGSFLESLQLEPNKPDFRELDHIDSPISPLRTHPTTTSSSSSSSASGSGRPELTKKQERRHSGELSGSGDSSPTGSVSVRSGPTSRVLQSGHVRSNSTGSGLVHFTGSVTSPPPPPGNILPAGNICPTGKILKTGMARPSSRTDVLGSGSGHYGHGSIMRGGGSSSGIDVITSNSRGNFSGSISSSYSVNDGEEVKRAGNEKYKRGNYMEALLLYEKAIALSPGIAAYRSNRAAALTKLGLIGEAVRECEEALRLDPGYWRAHQRLGSLFTRLGQVENARRHLCIPGHGQPDPSEMLKLQEVEKHMSKCTDARKIGDWKCVLREAETTIAAGADFSPELFACKAEALLKLHKLEDPDHTLSDINKLEQSSNYSSQAKFSSMISEAYLHFVRAQIEMSLGRFENAVASAEKAGQIDSQNFEISVLGKNVKLVARARARGNDLFKSERITEARSAYEEGLKIDPSNAVLYCNRAACWFKNGMWELSIEDSNKALSIQPNYTKALLRRAASNCKLERWADAVRDYEALRRVLPDDIGVAESLFHAQVALKKSRGEDVHNMKFGGEVESVADLEQFKAAITSPGVSVVHFKAASNRECQEISPAVDQICQRYPSVNFLKVDVEERPEVANLENVKILPTFKIYRNGIRLKEMICPSRQVLESSVRHYSF